MTITRTADADDVYAELLKTKAFVVPENNPERLKHWPTLGFKEMEVTGINENQSTADVVLSSAGNLSLNEKLAFPCNLLILISIVKDGSRSLQHKLNVFH